MVVRRFLIDRPERRITPSSEPPVVFVLQPWQHHTAHPLFLHQRINRCVAAHQHYAHRRVWGILDRERIDVYRTLHTRHFDLQFVHAMLLPAKHLHVFAHALPTHAFFRQLRIIARHFYHSCPALRIRPHRQRHPLYRETTHITQRQHSHIARTHLALVIRIRITDLDVVRLCPAFC